jgi:hypothetical protein
MAGFQLTLHGRIWVIPEAKLDIKEALAEHNAQDHDTHLSSI